MLLPARSWMVAAAAVVAVTCTACQSKTIVKPVEQADRPAATPKNPKNPKNVETSPEPPPQPAAKAAKKPATHKPRPEAPPPPPTIPKVLLSNELRATCLVNVGGTMPEAELPDPAGKLHALESLYGQKLTVVCLWTIGTKPYSRLAVTTALKELTEEVVKPFGAKGVQVVGINVGNVAAAVEQELAQAKATFPNLLDPKGAYLAKIAKDKRMPRVFLLDSGGRILWFDLEYSRSSRRDLIQSIRVALGEL
jgi:hypothetical protein